MRRFVKMLFAVAILSVAFAASALPPPPPWNPPPPPWKHSVPEPLTLVGLGIGGAGLYLARRRAGRKDK